MFIGALAEALFTPIARFRNFMLYQLHQCVPQPRAYPSQSLLQSGLSIRQFAMLPSLPRRQARCIGDVSHLCKASIQLPRSYSAKNTSWWRLLRRVMLRTSHASDGSMDILHVRLCEIRVAVPYCIQSEWLSRACEGHAR